MFKRKCVCFFWVCARTTKTPKQIEKLLQLETYICGQCINVHLPEVLGWLQLISRRPFITSPLNSTCRTFHSACASVLAAAACGQVVLSEPCNVLAQALDVLTSSVRLCQRWKRLPPVAIITTPTTSVR